MTSSRRVTTWQTQILENIEEIREQVAGYPVNLRCLVYANYSRNCLVYASNSLPQETSLRLVASSVQNFAGKQDSGLDPENTLSLGEVRGCFYDASTGHESSARGRLHPRGSVSAPIRRAVGPPARHRRRIGTHLGLGQCR